MGVYDQLSDVEMREVESKRLECTDAAFAAVDRIMQSKKPEIDRIKGLRTKLMNVCIAQVARYEEFAKEWINSYGNLENRGQGVTFKDNFVNGVVKAIQDSL